MNITPLDLSKLKVLPLKERQSLTRADEILIDPDRPAKACPESLVPAIRDCAEKIRAARQRGASVMLIYGAHLLRNGAGTIHDWEYAWFGASTESVEMNVASGTFGTWNETAENIHLAIMSGALDGLGYGRSLARFIHEDGVTLPAIEELSAAIAAEPAHPLTAARADLLQAMKSQGWPAGRIEVNHRWKQASILAQAWKHDVPLTVHPGIGYDIISNHPVFSGSAIGRGAEWDFKLFGGSVDELDGGVVLSVGSAIMGPQVFEKSLSCVNNLRLQSGLPIVQDHSIYVVDLQDGGNWDWTQGEPPKTNAAYYLRFCKSYSRMGGAMHYLQCDNATFIHNLFHELSRA
jgi:hypothetical protein